MDIEGVGVEVKVGMGGKRGERERVWSTERQHTFEHLALGTGEDGWGTK